MVSGLRVIVGAVSVLCWAMSIHKIRDLHRDRGNRPLRALCVALWAITLALTVQPLAALIDRLSGVLDLGRVLGNCLTVASAAAAQGFLIYMTDVGPATVRRVRRRYAIAAIVVVAIAVLFARQHDAYAVTDPYVSDGRYYSRNPHPF